MQQFPSSPQEPSSSVAQPGPPSSQRAYSPSLLIRPGLSLPTPSMQNQMHELAKTLPPPRKQNTACDACRSRKVKCNRLPGQDKASKRSLPYARLNASDPRASIVSGILSPNLLLKSPLTRRCSIACPRTTLARRCSRSRHAYVIPLIGPQPLCTAGYEREEAFYNHLPKAEESIFR
jgi:hypothetical protein